MIYLVKYLGKNSKIRIAEEYKIDGSSLKVVSLEEVFRNKKVQSVIIPESVTTISKNAFSYSKIKYLFLPSTVHSFNGWKEFTDMQVLYYGGSQSDWEKLCSVQRSELDIIRIITDAKISDLYE